MAWLSDEQVAAVVEPGENLPDELQHLRVTQVHQQPVGEHQVAAETTHSPVSFS